MPGASPGDRCGLGDGGAVDVRYRRITEPDDEDWSLTLLISNVPPNEAQLAFLSDISAEPGGIAALVAADPDGGSAAAAPSVFALAGDPDRAGGILARITPLQLQVRPQVLTSADYEAIISLFETAAAPGDVAADEPPYDGAAWSAAVTPQSWPDWDEADDTDPGQGASDWDPAGAGIDADGSGSDPFDPDPDDGLYQLAWDPAQDPDLAADWDPVPPAGSQARHRAPPAKPAWQTDDTPSAQLSGAPVLDHDELLDRGAQVSRNGHAASPGTETSGGAELPGGLDLANGGAVAGDSPPGRAEGSGRPLSPVLASGGDRAGPARPGRPDAMRPGSQPR
jgi:hypothetical protein